MMTQATHGMPHPISLATWLAICSIARHSLEVIRTSSARTSYRRRDNARACLGNTRGSLHAVAAKPTFISMAHGLWRAMGHVLALKPTSEVGAVWSRRARVSAGPLLSGKAGSGVKRCVVAPDPSQMVRQGLKPLGTWQRWSPPRWRRGIWSLGHVAAPVPS
jgi:hypothetical protein